MQKGFTIIEILMVLAILAIIAAIAVPGLHQARLKAEIGALAGDSRAIYVAFKQFYVDNGMFPNASSSPAFHLQTFNPLRSGAYYRGNVTRLLVGNRADAYDSPDDMGNNQEFWLEMTLLKDPSVRFVVAHSNDAPLGGGQWLDGVYLFRDGTLQKL